VQLAARKRRFEHIARIHRAFGLARAHHGVQLVDKNDETSLVLRQFFEHRFEAFLKLAAILRSRQQRGQVERQNALALERFGDFLIHDTLRQPFDNGRLAHPGFADQHRIVLGAALQDLDRAANLVVAPDHRIELALTRALGQIQRIFFQRLPVRFALRIVHLRTAAHGVNRRFQRLALQARLAQQTSGLALVIGQRQQKQLAGNIRIAAPRRFLVRARKRCLQIAPGLHVRLIALHLWQIRDGGLHRRGQPIHRHPCTRQQTGRTAVRIGQKRRQHMYRLNVGIIVARRQTLRLANRLLKFRRQLVKSHGKP